MTVVFHAWSNSRFIEMECNFLRKNVHGPKQVTSFARNSFPIQRQYSETSIHPLHFFLSNLYGQMFTLFCSTLERALLSSPIHEYFQALLATTVFKVKICFKKKVEGILKTAGGLGEGLQHFSLRFDQKSPNCRSKKYTKPQ